MTEKQKQYRELLKRPEWKEKASEIIKRDKGRCVMCRKTTTLQVHHKWYIEGKMPWEVPDKYLITVCREHHEAIHKKRPAFTMEKKANGKIKRIKPKKLSEEELAKRQLKQAMTKLSKKDKELQAKYDRLKQKQN